jgi:hypothetical protein
MAKNFFQVTEDDISHTLKNANHYVGLAKKYKEAGN